MHLTVRSPIDRQGWGPPRSLLVAPPPPPAPFTPLRVPPPPARRGAPYMRVVPGGVVTYVEVPVPMAYAGALSVGILGADGTEIAMVPADLTVGGRVNITEFSVVLDAGTY